MMANEEPVPIPIDLVSMAHMEPGRKPVWAQQSTDLNVNLISLVSGQQLASHVNAEVDVLLVGIDGTGAVEIDCRRHDVRPGHAVVIPKGSQRSMQSHDEWFTYLTCHRRRAALQPSVPQPGDGARRRKSEAGEAARQR